MPENEQPEEHDEQDCRDVRDDPQKLKQAHTDASEVESARDLLRAAGKIKVKEEQGYYTFFSTEELAEAMLELGFRNPKGQMSFGNQASVVVAEK